jgi:hypothetical protein
MFSKDRGLRLDIQKFDDKIDTAKSSVVRKRIIVSINVSFKVLVILDAFLNLSNNQIKGSTIFHVSKWKRKKLYGK